jgi:hypothetical protein
MIARPDILQALDYATIEQIDFQVCWVALAPPFCLLGAFLLDCKHMRIPRLASINTNIATDIGRRPILLFGVGGCCIWLCVLAAALAQLDRHPSNLALGKLGVAALYLFNACYNTGVDVGGNVYYGEVFPNHRRHMGVSITNAVLALSDLVYLQVLPVAFANIRWKFLLVSPST